MLARQEIVASSEKTARSTDDTRSKQRPYAVGLATAFLLMGGPAVLLPRQR